MKGIGIGKIREILFEQFKQIQLQLNYFLRHFEKFLIPFSICMRGCTRIFGIDDFEKKFSKSPLVDDVIDDVTAISIYLLQTEDL